MYRELGAMIDAERVACNLLSSAPLVFNLFAPMAQELLHASSVLNELFPIATAHARRVLFEHRPARGSTTFLGDFSAFDLLVEYIDSNGCPGFVAVEVKFTEAMAEPIPTWKPRYDELSEVRGLFIDLTIPPAVNPECAIATPVRLKAVKDRAAKFACQFRANPLGSNL